MSRLAALMLLAGGLAAADGYTFAGAPRFYGWRLEQTVEQETTGDRLRHSTVIDWDLAIEGRPGGATITILAVRASHDGPGTAARLDTAQRIGLDDPLLGSFAVLDKRSLDLDVDPITGTVAAVRGGDAIAEAALAGLRKRLQGEPSAALAERTRAVWSTAVLARTWTRILALPGTSGRESVDLGAGSPVRGEVQRTWSGSTYTLALPAGTPDLPVTISPDPALPIIGRITELTGKGTTKAPSDGWPAGGSHELVFRLTIDAAGQPVGQRHTIRWSLAPKVAR